MADLKFDKHISRAFNAELTEVRDKVLAMGGRVDEQIRKAVRALCEGDRELADAVISADYEVNAMEVDIDEECSRILALRAPTALDLRLVIAVIKTITDLERIGDEAERVARMTLEADTSQIDQMTLGELAHMGEMVRNMLEQALDAFARNDPRTALATSRLDADVDRKYQALTRQLITFMAQDARNIPACLSALWAARALERIGDRSCNICEYIIYLVGGKDVRHTSPEKMEAAAEAADSPRPLPGSEK